MERRKRWEAIGLDLTARHDGRGHVSLDATLSHDYAAADRWRVRATLIVEAGSLARLAREALCEITAEATIGELVDQRDEGEGVTTLSFAAEMPGYDRSWRDDDDPLEAAPPPRPRDYERRPEPPRRDQPVYGDREPAPSGNWTWRDLLSNVDDERGRQAARSEAHVVPCADFAHRSGDRRYD